jgi:hypothetical protein
MGTSVGVMSEPWAAGGARGLGCWRERSEGVGEPTRRRSGGTKKKPDARLVAR